MEFVTRSNVSRTVADQLATQLTGLARVYATSDKWAEFAISDSLGRGQRFLVAHLLRAGIDGEKMGPRFQALLDVNRESGGPAVGAKT